MTRNRAGAGIVGLVLLAAAVHDARAAEPGAPSVPGGAPTVPGGAPAVPGGAPAVPGGAPTVPGGAPAVPGGGEPRSPRGPAEPLSTPVELRHDLRVDGAVTAGLAASTITTMLVRDEFQPGECRWCDGPRPSDLNGFDDWFRTALRRPDTTPASLTSHVLAFGLGPLSAGGLLALSAVLDRRQEGVVPDLVIAAQGAISAVLLTEVIKPIVVRPRPFAHAIEDDEARREEYTNPESMRSFPSGHTTAVFGTAAASGMVASMRGYRLAPLIWATGIMLGVATAYARIAADKHYMTDTLGGAAIGLVVGGGVPLLFHPPVASEPSASLRFVRTARFSTTSVPGGRVVSVGWIF